MPRNTKSSHCNNRHRHRQEHVPSRRSRPEWRDRSAPEAFTPPNRGSAREYALIDGGVGGIAARFGPSELMLLSTGRAVCPSHCFFRRYDGRHSAPGITCGH
jgi:hypothetical protein